MAKIGLDLKREDVSVEDFTDAFLAQIRLVREVMIEMNLAANEIRWVIAELHAGSAYAVAQAQLQGKHIFMDDVEKAIAAAASGVRQLDRAAERPPFFNDEALKTAGSLSQIAAKFDTGKAHLLFGATRFAPSARVSENVGTIIKGNIKSIGSIEGKLVGVQGSDGSYHIFVRDRLRNRQVRCNIPHADLPRALANFESRVIVRGIIWSRPDGSAVRIDAKDFVTIPPDDELPTLQQVRGILG